MRRTTTVLSLLLLVLGLAPRPASAAPILGGTLIVAADGNVFATFLGNFAGDISALFLCDPNQVFCTAGSDIFSNDPTIPPGTSVGTVVDLGFFTAGTELVFGLRNDTNNDEPNWGTYYTGSASRNPDNHFHAVVDNDPQAINYPAEYAAIIAALPAGQTLVGFEDRPDCAYFGVTCTDPPPTGLGLPGETDFDYNDLIYSFTNVNRQVPEPATFLLLGAGAVGFVVRRRKQRKAL